MPECSHFGIGIGHAVVFAGCHGDPPAGSVARGGPRGWHQRGRIWMTTIGPPQHGQGGGVTGSGSGASAAGVGMTFSSSRTRARLALRLELASRP